MTVDKNLVRYLDLEGLKALLADLKADNRLIKHFTHSATENQFFKVEVDANGHVVSTTPVTYEDLKALGAAHKDDIKDSTITLSINDVEKSFTLNQATNSTLEWSLADLGLTNALHFRGIAEALPEDLSGYSAGDVLLVNKKEYVLAINVTTQNKEWHELGDEGSHALKDIQVSGDDTWITGGGTLASDIKLSHVTNNNWSKDKAAYKVEIDAAGHVVNASPLTIKAVPDHAHTATVDIAPNTYGTSIKPNTQKLGLARNAGETATVITGYNSPEKSHLLRTSIRGVADTTTKASKATAQTEIKYGQADVGATVTGIAKRGSQINYGMADVDTEALKAISGLGGTAYTATYVEADECLSLTALQPEFTKEFNGAVACAQTRLAYVCTSDEVTVTSAKEAADSQKFTPYNFEDVDVPVLDTDRSWFATGYLGTADANAGAEIVYGLGTASTETVVKKEATYGVELGASTGVDVLTGAELVLNNATNTLNVTVQNAGGHTPEFED